MNVPLPPTDSFYKFCALIGTISILLSFYFLFHFAKYIDNQVFTAKCKLDRARIEMSYWKDKGKSFSKIISNSIEEKKGIKHNSTDQIEIDYSQSELKQMENELKDISKQVELENADQANLIKQLSRYVIYFLILLAVSICFIILSARTSYFGYTNWYNIQKCEDAILFRSLKMAEKEIEDNSSKS
jgi:hypothetical protein